MLLKHELGVSSFNGCRPRSLTNVTAREDKLIRYVAVSENPLHGGTTDWRGHHVDMTRMVQHVVACPCAARHTLIRVT